MDDRVLLELKDRYLAATESFVDRVREDPNVIAVIVCGSLAYDSVWEKSDIDMGLVVRDQTLQQNAYCLVEDGITINVQLFERSTFKRGFERMIGGSMPQSFFAKGRMIYTSDDSLYDYFEDFKQLGSYDIALSLLWNACELIDVYHKCQKWLTVRKDLLYAQYFLLKAGSLIANMELCSQGEPPIRESVLKILEHSPERMAPFYQNPMSRRLSEDEIQNAIDTIGQFLDRHLDMIKRPVIEFMADQEMKTVTLLAKHFHMQSHFLINILEYMAGKGVIEKVSQTIRITSKSKPAVEEIGFLYIP
ncbi:nucleotidyltransferase [Paenibacillus sp. FSL H7-0357]|uniref:nucleotidyltransferase n=1 Tax=Paenibacillus sp. FSL H7-0357 TaxID=1536774 RepID=UPI0004F60C38|nr:nucleotidyltransferase [Paenibacillus sp. FSL H7-0357]AIQ17312.1 nucleotidyltransferase [Paenibacillus sp. FSL H7-0357]